MAGKTPHAAPSAPRDHWQHETFWSEKGLGREELLRAMRLLASSHDLTWRETGDQSTCDAILVTRQRKRVGVTTVTEYHADGKCLTRVAYGLAPWMDAWQVLVFASMVLLIMFGASTHWWIAPPVFALIIWRAFVNVGAIREVRRLIRAASASATLLPEGGASEAGPAEVHERMLATAGRSGEM
jgi:hypothetical protein